MEKSNNLYARKRRRLATARAVLAAGLGLGGIAVAFAFGGEFPSKVPVPADNPMTPAKISLGKQLFFDPRLSLTGDVSCQTCHDVMSNGSDSLPLAFGVLGRVDTPRHPPSVFNAAFNTVQFWDGRANSLEAQAKGPILNPVEMGMPNAAEVVKRLQEIPGYREEFRKVFGDKDPITFDHIAQAIATYERTLVTPDSPYDRYVKGDKTAISSDAKAGINIIRSFGCEACHAGPMFDNPGTPMGTGWFQKFPVQPHNPVCAKYVQKYHLTDDLGRFDVTHNPADKHFFKVPSWRNVALQAPYFQNGSVRTLQTAVRVMAACQLGQTLTDKQVTDIVSFLDSLTGKFPKETMPQLPETPNTTIMMDVSQLQKTAEKTEKK